MRHCLHSGSLEDYEAIHSGEQSVDLQCTSSADEIRPVRVTMLSVCKDGSCRVQIRRVCNYQPFGIYFKRNSQGLYIGRIAKAVEIESGGEYLQVNVRVLEVQGVPSDDLDDESIRELLKGCLVVNLKLSTAHLD